jgi:dTDP-4-amino-4,6-dideoxygalactose transaminase
LPQPGIGPGDGRRHHPVQLFRLRQRHSPRRSNPVLADIDPATFNLDATAVEAVLNGPQPTPIRAILPVHLYGQCADWTAFARLGKEHGLKLIEDAAQAWGAHGRSGRA